MTFFYPGIECEHGYDACPICDGPEGPPSERKQVAGPVEPMTYGDISARLLSALVYVEPLRECVCLGCRGETCSCHLGHPPCSVCTDSCDPDDPETRIYADRCPICGCEDCGCERTR